MSNFADLIRPLMGMGFQALNNIIFLILLTRLQLGPEGGGADYVLLAASFFIARLFDIVPTNYAAALSIKKNDDFDVLSFSGAVGLLSIGLVATVLLIAGIVGPVSLRSGIDNWILGVFFMGTTLQGVSVMLSSMLDAFDLGKERVLSNWLSILCVSAGVVFIEDPFVAIVIYANGLVLMGIILFLYFMVRSFGGRFDWRINQINNICQLFRKFGIVHLSSNTFSVAIDSGSKLLLGSVSPKDLFQYELIYKANGLANVLVQAFVMSRFTSWLQGFRKSNTVVIRRISVVTVIIFMFANMFLLGYFAMFFSIDAIDLGLLVVMFLSFAFFSVANLWGYLAAFDGRPFLLAFANFAGIIVSYVLYLLFDFPPQYFAPCIFSVFSIGLFVWFLLQRYLTLAGEAG
jgi:hypothetical protein